MLYQLGAVQFELIFNPQSFDSDASAGIVEKPVMGRRPPLEFVGDGPQIDRIGVRLFPEKLGGMGGIEDLNEMRISGIPQFLMRGDYRPLGWFAIERVVQRHTYLGAGGIGRVVDVDLVLRRADPPSASSVFSSLVGFLR